MKKFLLILSLPLAFVACDNKKNPIEAAKVAAKDKDLQGTYQSECNSDPLTALWSGVSTGFQASVKSSRTQYIFEGQDVTRKYAIYNNANCDGEAYVYEETGTFDISPDKRTNDNAKVIDMKFDKVELTVSSDAGVKVANAQALCGLKDWAKGKQADVTAQSPNLVCYAAKVPRQDSNVYHLDAGKLQLGSDNTQTREDGDRPASAGGTVYTKK